MIKDNNTTCPNCDALLIKGEDVCQVCGESIKPEQKDK